LETARFEKTPMMYINDLSKMFRDRMKVRCEEAGIPSSYHRIMIDLFFNDGLTQLELAKRSHVTPPTVSVTLQKMEHDGLITRLTDESDQRQMRVSLTEKGRALEIANHQKAKKTEEEILSALTEEEKQSLYDILKKMYGGMTYYGKEPHDEKVD